MLTLRKPIVVLALLPLTLVAVRGAAYSQGVEIKLKLFGGYNYLVGGDLNAGTEGLADLYLDGYHAVGFTVGGEFQPAHSGATFGGDLILMFTPSVGIGLGSEYLRSSTEADFSLTRGSDTASILASPEASAVPLKVSLYVSVPAGASGRMTLHVGVGYYLARMSSLVRLDAGTDFLEWKDTADGNGFGFHGGIGFEFDLSANAGLFLEARGRYAKFDGFSGETAFNTGMGGGTASGDLYYLEQVGLISQYYPLIVISDTEPGPSPFARNIRKAKIDFSGGSLVGGLYIRF